MRLGVEAAIVEGELVPGDVEVAGGQLAELGLSGPGSGVAVPGFVDLQVNGFAGVDLLAEPERVGEVDEALARRGVLAWQPTLITAAPEDVLRALPLLEAHGVLGVHLEGPFLSPAKPGTHPVRHLREPDLELLRRYLDAGSVSMVTLAPELPGALALVDELVARGVVVSLGHSNATAAEARAGFEHGAATVTHLFNAMRTFGHRDPGIAGAALADEELPVMAIVDGVHLAPETALLAWRAARGRFAVVTDAIAAAGTGDGDYTLGEVEVHVEGGVCTRADGTLAGSVVTMDASIRNLVELGVPPVEAVAAVTSVPARIAGRDDLGVLYRGGPANLVVLDDRLELARVLRAGEEVVRGAGG
ncbi:MAG TPA: N-acetylglucosamine-6-phosphate deacetylase [Gaiellaceae bacterium]|nr:N-acetylglucosamine-6-phosphate deacetylase [Gaiellaceae bacterium]